MAGMPSLPVTGVAVPKVDAVQSILIDHGFDLGCEIRDLHIGKIAESQPLAAAFDTHAQLTAFVLKRTVIFHVMVQNIAHIRAEAEFGASGFRFVIEPDGTQVDVLPTVLYPFDGRSAGQLFLHEIIIHQKGLVLRCVDVENKEQVDRREVHSLPAGADDRNRIIKHLPLIDIGSIFIGDGYRQQVFSRLQTLGRHLDSFRVGSQTLLGYGQGFTVRKFTIRFRQQFILRFIRLIETVQKRIIDPNFQRKALGSGFGDLIIDIIRHKTGPLR